MQRDSPFAEIGDGAGDLGDGSAEPVAADQQSEDVELAVIAQRLVQEAVRRAHAPPRLLTAARHDAGAPIICVIAARIVWRASGSVIRRRDSSVR